MHRHSQLEEAASFVRRADFARAIDVYRSVLSVDPDNADVRADLADAYFRSGNRERAFHHFHRAATLYMNRAATERALAMLQSANGVSPNEPDILFRIAECLKTLGHRDALREPLFALVQVARAKGDRRRLWALEELTAIYPDELDLAEQYADALAEAGRLGEAVHLYKQVANCYAPNSADFLRVLELAIQASADQTELAVEVAKFALAHHRPKEALNILVPHYEERPDHIPVLETLLAALSAMGAADKIIPARIELIKARVKLNQRPQGLHDVAELVAQAPRHPQALEVAAHAYGFFGEAEQAKEVWRELLRIAEQASLRAECDRAALAILKTDPDDEEALMVGARSLRESGRVNEAVALEARLQEVRARNRPRPKSPPASAPESKRALARILPPSEAAAPVAPSRAGSRLQAPVLIKDEPFEERTHTEPVTGTMVLSDDDLVEVMDAPNETRRTQESAPAFPFASDDDESTVGADGAAHALHAPSAEPKRGASVGPINAKLRRVTNTQLASTDEVEALLKAAETLGEPPPEDGDLLVEDEATVGLLGDEDLTHNRSSTGGFSAYNPVRSDRGAPSRAISQVTHYGLEDPLATPPSSRARPLEEIDVDLEDAFEVSGDGEELRFGPEEVTSRVDPMQVAPSAAKPRRSSLVADLVEETEVFPSLHGKR